MRPHVLWFDEYYHSSQHYRFEQLMSWLQQSHLMLFAGCSGTLFLANYLVELAENQIPMIIVDPEKHEFVEKVISTGGIFLQGIGTEILPELFPEQS